MKICIGIISWLPDDQEVREVRLKRLRDLVYKCRFNMEDLHIFIIAQNWKGDEFEPRDYMTIYYYNKLGITGAREELRKRFLETKYDYIICLDDDFELTKCKVDFEGYIKEILRNPGKLFVFKNYLMNLCAMSRYIAEKYPFDTTISAENGTGFEDWVWVSVIEKKEPTHFRRLYHYNLAAKARKDLVEDKYSTWIENSTNKDDLTQKSLKLINELSK